MCWPFPIIKKMFQRKKFVSNKEVIGETGSCFESADKSSYKNAIEKLEERWNDRRFIELCDIYEYNTCCICTHCIYCIYYVYIQTCICIRIFCKTKCNISEANVRARQISLGDIAIKCEIYVFMGINLKWSYGKF